MKKVFFIRILTFALLAAAPFKAHAQPQGAPQPDTSPHKAQTVTTDDGAKLEVLDWGGTGRPLILLIGLGGTAHQFDKFALNFIANHHVYAVTRRGYGASSAPDPETSNYTAERLGKDVIAVIDALRIDKPVLAGHSVAGEELSAVANQQPEKISGLIYIDGGNAYAYYAPGNLIPFGVNLRMNFREIEAVLSAGVTNKADVQKLTSDISDLEKDIAAARPFPSLLSTIAPATEAPRPATVKSRQVRIRDAILAGAEKYTAIPVPVLALYAIRHAGENTPPAARAQIEAQAEAAVHVADQFEKGVPSARVVRIQGAAHVMWETHEADVVREMNAFMDGLK